MTRYEFVQHLPDLIHPNEYASDPDGRKLRVRIAVTAEGLEIIGDAVRPECLEALLEALEAQIVEQMLCG